MVDDFDTIVIYFCRKVITFNACHTTQKLFTFLLMGWWCVSRITQADGWDDQRHFIMRNVMTNIWMVCISGHCRNKCLMGIYCASILVEIWDCLKYENYPSEGQSHQRHLNCPNISRWYVGTWCTGNESHFPDKERTDGWLQTPVWFSKFRPYT